MGILAAWELVPRPFVHGTEAGADPADPLSTFNGLALTGSPVFGWVRKPGSRRRFREDIWYEVDSDGFLTVDSPQLLDTVTPRVAFVGDSNTFGYGVPTEASFVEVVDARLRGVNAINLGVPGYSSYQGLLVVREHLDAIRPKVVVVSFNFNDRRFAATPDDSAWAQRIYRASDAYVTNRVRRWLARSSYVVRSSRWLLGHLAPWAPAVDYEPPSIRTDAVVPRVGEDSYRQNLGTIVSEVRDRGATPVFMILRDNPGEIRAVRTTVNRLQNGEDEMNRAIRELESVARNPDNEYAVLARLQLARSVQGKGDDNWADTLLASPVYLEAVDGGMPIRLDTAYNDIMYEVAEAYEVTVIDAASLLEDPEVFLDVVHFNVGAHHAVGELVAATIAPLFN